MPAGFQYPTVDDFNVTSNNGVMLLDGSWNDLSITGGNFNADNCIVRVSDSEGNNYDVPVDPDRPSNNPLHCRVRVLLQRVKPPKKRHKLKDGEAIRPATVTVTVTNNPAIKPASNPPKSKTVNVGP